MDGCTWRLTNCRVPVCQHNAQTSDLLSLSLSLSLHHGPVGLPTEEWVRCQATRHPGASLCVAPRGSRIGTVSSLHTPARPGGSRHNCPAGHTAHDCMHPKARRRGRDIIAPKVDRGEEDGAMWCDGLESVGRRSEPVVAEAHFTVVNIRRHAWGDSEWWTGAARRE